MSKNFVEAKNLCKRYGNVVALDGVTFTSDAKLLALVGPNGAGKTTFIKISTCLLRPTNGHLKILGYDVSKECNLLKERISLMPQDANPDTACTPFEHIVYYLFSRGYKLSESKRRAREILEKIGLWEYKDEKCIKLSGGMKKMVLLAMAFAPEVNAVFLDEPTAGLDPVNRVKIWGLIARLAREGVHVLVTSHNMEEVEEYAEEVVMINRGKIVIQGSPRELIDTISNLMRIEITLKDGKMSKDLLKMFRNIDGTRGVYNLESTVIIYVDKNDVSEIAEKLSQMDINIAMKIWKCNLKDVFLRHVL